MIDKLGRRFAEGIDMIDWYDNAKEQITKICEHSKWDFKRFCNVYAMCSVRRKDDEAARLTFYYMEHGKFPEREGVVYGGSTYGGINPSTKAAFRNFEKNGVPNGPKTRDFALALMGSTDVVPVDRWVLRAFDVVKPNAKIINKCKELIIKLAQHEWDYTAVQIQAGLWAGMKRIFNEMPKYSAILEQYNSHICVK